MLESNSAGSTQRFERDDALVSRISELVFEEGVKSHGPAQGRPEGSAVWPLSVGRFISREV